MNSPRVYMCSQSWTLLPLPSLYHPSGSSQCTSPKHPVSCIDTGLAIHFLYDIIHVSMPFSQIIPPSPSPTESKSLFYMSVSLLLSCIHFMCLLVTCTCSLEKCLLDRPLIFNLSYLVYTYGAAWAVCVFWRLILCQFGCKYFLSFCGFSFCFVYDFLCYAKAFKFS